MDTSTNDYSASLFHQFLFWLLLFLICVGLGYPTLNRYDSRAALPDVAVYHKLALEGPHAEASHMRYRLLVPYLVRPLYHLVKGHTGTWDPLAFSFLIVTSAFTASTAYLIVLLGLRLAMNTSAAMLGGFLYLLNFAVPNLRLVGLIDAGEGFFLLAIIYCMAARRWWLLPAVGVFGTLTKESFVPLSVAMVVFWWIYRDRAVADRANDGRPVPWIIALLITNIGTLTLLQWIVTDRIVFFWAFGVGMNSGGNYLEVFIDSLFDRNLWYVFIWLAPLGAIELRKFPKPWLGATFAGIGMAFLLNSYYGGAPGTVGRAVFSVAGPLLSLSAGLYLSVLRLRTLPQE